MLNFKCITFFCIALVLSIIHLTAESDEVVPTQYCTSVSPESRKHTYQEAKKYSLVSGLPDVYISAKTEQIGATWLGNDVWDKPLIEKCCSILKTRGDFFVFLDVGAQTGSFTLLAKYFPNSKWYAFEPIAEAVSELQVNLSLNSIKNVTVYQVCVSDCSGWENLRLPKDTHWGLATLGKKLVRFREYEERRVKSVTLDEFGEMENVERVDFIKIDTEGWELFVLRGGMNLINKHKPIILMEFNKDNMRQTCVNENDIYWLLEDIGYNWEVVSSDDILCTPNGVIDFQ